MSSPLGLIEPLISPTPEVKVTLAAPEPYVPVAGEPIPEVKRLAADVLQAIGTYRKTEGTLEGANARLAGRASPEVVQKAQALLIPTAVSAVDMIYPQVSGLTQTDAGIMAVFRQRILEEGQERSVTRVADLRFKKGPQGWQISELNSLGGEPRPNPKPLSASAQAVLLNDRIRLPEPARWDIEAGIVDERVLQTLLTLAAEHSLDVTVLAGGHPRNVFASKLVSNHTVGRAVDIWAVDDLPVIAQRDPAGPLNQLVRTLLTRGVTELGSPWDVDGPKGSSFTDTVHQDHLHLAFDR